MFVFTALLRVHRVFFEVLEIHNWLSDKVPHGLLRNLLHVLYVL
jgi:hypothetical protein